MFEGMDVDMMKGMRKVARVNDLKNRRPASGKCACGDLLTIEDGARCRQCVLAERFPWLR